MIGNVNGAYSLIIGLIGFGILCNQFTAWLGERRRGYTSLLASGGVAGTVLLISPWIGWEHTLYILGAFTFSGLPMIIGSIARYINERQKEVQAIRREQDHG